MVEGYFGLWCSHTGDEYIQAEKKMMPKAGFAIGMEEGEECEGSNGPVRAYAGRRNNGRGQM